jgi:hypothetical protein
MDTLEFDIEAEDDLEAEAIALAILQLLYEDARAESED